VLTRDGIMGAVSRRAWVTVGAVAWAVVLVVAGTYATRHGKPTVREQTTIVEALPTLDRAVAAVVQAAAGPRVVVSLGGYERTSNDCKAGNRTGERYERVATVYTVPGEEPALFDRIATGLPARYEPVVRHAKVVHSLRADAGFYVRLTGDLDAPGAVRFTAETGCRMRGGTVPAARAATAPPATGDVLGRLGVSGGQATSFAVLCASGKELDAITVTAPRPGGPLAAALPDGVAPIIARADLVVYERAGLGVAARLRDGDLQVTAATGCQ
jgi:hypothetical protein